MILPYHFPDPREEACARAREFQELSSTERWREIAAMMAFGLAMVASSPDRARIEQRMAEQEDEAQRIHADLFQRHGR
jgi:hypothetical protein